MAPKLNVRDIMSAINSRPAAAVRFGPGILKWTKKEQKELNRKSRKLLTMNATRHPCADTDRLYMNKKKGKRGLISVDTYRAQGLMNT